MHRAGFAHRDIKLDNFIVTKQGEIFLIDFGLIRTLAGEPGFRQTGFFVTEQGGRLYFCPEVLNDS